MKKFVSVLITLIMVVSCVSVFADEIPEVFVNEKKIEFDVGPTVIDGTLMYPVRFICEAMEASVVWNEDTSSVIIVTVSQSGEQEVVMIQIGNGDMFMIDKNIPLSKAPVEIGGRTLVPADFFENAFSGFFVSSYDGTFNILKAAE